MFWNLDLLWKNSPRVNVKNEISSYYYQQVIRFSLFFMRHIHLVSTSTYFVTDRVPEIRFSKNELQVGVSCIFLHFLANLFIYLALYLEKSSKFAKKIMKSLVKHPFHYCNSEPQISGSRSVTKFTSSWRQDYFKEPKILLHDNHMALNKKISCNGRKCAGI